MPNSLAHIGLGGPATRLLLKDADVKWILVGCILPDVPWILQRVVHAIAPAIDPYSLLFYVTIQGSLAFCLLLGAALAALSSRFGRTWTILGLNSLLHLLLDACEIKWASGVHLFAPFSWKFLSFGIFWLEGPVVYSLTILGLVFIVATWRRAVATPPDLSFRCRMCVTMSAVFLTAYLVLPFVFLRGPQRADNHFAGTLLARSERPGRYVEFDRAIYVPGATGDVLRIFSGEELQIEGVTNRQPSAISIRGTFVGESRVRAIEYRLNSNGFRNGASQLTLFLVALLWINSWWVGREPRTRARKSDGALPR